MANPTTVSRGNASADQLVDLAADKAEQTLGTVKRVANDTLEQLQDGVSRARESASGTLSRSAAQVEELARRGVERARELGNGVSDQVERASDQTVGFIKDEPVKAVLIAAGLGVAFTLLVSALTRSKRS